MMMMMMMMIIVMMIIRVIIRMRMMEKNNIDDDDDDDDEEDGDDDEEKNMTCAMTSDFLFASFPLFLPLPFIAFLSSLLLLFFLLIGGDVLHFFDENSRSLFPLRIGPGCRRRLLTRSPIVRRKVRIGAEQKSSSSPL